MSFQTSYILEFSKKLCNVFCSGLLTVDPRQRITMVELRASDWLTNSSSRNHSTTPLCTPEMLSLSKSSVSHVQDQISVTLTAFHKAYREGFRLQDVDMAPLARRRKLKKNSRSSSSSDSSHGGVAGRCVTPTAHFSISPQCGSPARNLSSNSAQSHGSSTGFTPLKPHNLDSVVVEQALTLPSEYFSFHEMEEATSSSSAMGSVTTTATASSSSQQSSRLTELSSSDESISKGTKRKLEIFDESDNDDCFIVDDDCLSTPTGDVGIAMRTNSDCVNNNADDVPSHKMVVSD